ncbi:hypothetical protein D3C71_1899610 [compost metagenome]
MATGLYMGIKIAIDLFRDSAAQQFPEITAATLSKLVETGEQVGTLFGWGVAFIAALFVGHIVFGILALLAVNDEDKKARQNKD